MSTTLLYSLKSPNSLSAILLNDAGREGVPASIARLQHFRHGLGFVH